MPTIIIDCPLNHLSIPSFFTNQLNQQMRTKKELLEFMIERYEPPCRGLCYVVTLYHSRQDITDAERDCLNDILEKELPPPKRKFFGYCWKPSEVEPRVKFLNELIEKYK